MINYQLYIENQLMDVDEKLSFPLNKILEELNDPTLIKVEWSKTIQLPMTNNNNLFFGNYFRLDNVTVASGNGSISGVYFDPTQKLNFRIVYNSDIVMEGYAKMLSNNNSSKKKVYELSLYGKLGEVLNKIKTISLNPADAENYIGDVLTPGLKLNKELVKASFEHDDPVLNLGTCGDLDIIGFAMSNRGLYEEFDSKTFINNKKIRPIGDYINKKNNVTSSEDFFPDGMNEHEVNEFRSYYQKPYVYVNKVIQLIQRWVNNNTDYTLNLSDTWFNYSNPYWTRFIMMCKQIDVKKNNTLFNRYNLSDALDLTIYTPSNPNHGNNDNIGIYYTAKVFEQQTVRNSENNLDIEFGTKSYVIDSDFSTTVLVNHSGDKTIKFADNQGLKVTFKTFPVNGSPVNPYTYTILLTSAGNTTDLSYAYDDYIEIEFNSPAWAASISKEFKMLGKHLFKNIEGEYKIGITVEPTTYGSLFTTTSGGSLSFDAVTVNVGSGQYNPYQATNPIIMNINDNNRSDKIIKFKDFFPEDYKISDILFNYVKTFNLMFDIDYQNKSINIIDKANYYKDYEIEDWTDKIDRTQDMIQVPNSFESKYIVLNYDDSENKFNKAYKEKYGINYGGYKLATMYEFNDGTKELFKGLKPSIVSSEPYLNFKLFSNKLDYTKYLSTQILPAIYKSDGNKKTETDAFGQFYFRNRSVFFTNNELTKLNYYISDDSSYMIMHDNYCYGDIINKTNMLSTNKYPLIDIIYVEWEAETPLQLYGCTFNKPAEVYTNTTAIYNGGYSNTTKYIYDACWKNWIHERYDVNSKVLTAYFNLNLVDYNLFKFKKFIKIDNVLYSVNKIYNFDVNSLKPTKVELLRVTDINNYLNANVDFSIES